MYKITQSFSSHTFLAERDGCRFVLKQFSLSEINTVKSILDITSSNVAAAIETTEINGKFFIVFEYTDGETLESYVEAKKALPYSETVKIASDICEGLQAIHKQGLVHRDINPKNVIILPNGDAVIIDFGIARLYDDDKTNDTQFLGTPGYAAPEQFGFEQSDLRADIYATGVLINYMLTGKLPREQLASGKLKNVVVCCTQMDKDRRYQSAKELENAIKFGRRKGKSIIPGFRSNKTSHKIIATIYYLFLFIMYAVPADTKYNLKYILTWTLTVTLVMVVPVMIGVDFLDWTNRLKITSGLTKRGKTILLITLFFLTEFLILWICSGLLPHNWYFTTEK